MWNTSENKIVLYMIRHAKTEGNCSKKFIGKTDEGLLDDLEYVFDDELSDADMMFASPMKRCVQTADMINSGLNIITIDEFSETDFGILEGKSHAELIEDIRYTDWLKNDGEDGYPGGEKYEDARMRFLTGFKKMIALLETNCDVGKIISIVHGGTIMSVMEHLFGGRSYDYHVDNLCGYKLTMLKVDGRYICDTVETFTAIK